MSDTRPQVYVSTTGGITYTFLDGDVDLIEVDWDNYRDSGILDYQIEDLRVKALELARIRNPDVREQALQSILDAIDRWHADTAATP